MNFSAFVDYKLLLMYNIMEEQLNQTNIFYTPYMDY